MHIGWCSVSPAARTGYGGVTREIVKRLLPHHEVTCIGHESDVVVWGGKKDFPLTDDKMVETLVMMNPLVNEDQAAEALKSYIRNYDFDIIIGFWDAFALNFLKKIDHPYLAHIPIDGPCTSTWASYVEDALKVVPYSQYGYDELNKFFPASRLRYVPHGIDTDTFQPRDVSPSDIAAAPRIPDDAFLFTTVAANVGPRKALPQLIQTFKKFVERYDDAHLYIHTNPMGADKGYDLIKWRDMQGLHDHVHFPATNPILEPKTERELAEVYAASDVLISNSCAEGFGVPLLEAQACGTPVIAPQNSSQTELVQEAGWLVDNVPSDVWQEVPVYVPQLTEYPVPDQRHLLSRMGVAYRNPQSVARRGEAARRFAEGYDWDEVMPRWLELFRSVEELL